MGLGRGLASLISRREETEVSPDDMLEQIDSMELEDEIVIPKKPLVTQISFDEEVKAVPRKIAVDEIQEDDEEAEEIQKTPEIEVETEEDEVAEEVAPEVAPVAAQDDGKIEGDSWDQHEGSVQHIAIGDITINPLQPRRTFDSSEMQDLKESIERNGILQPLVVHRLESGVFELIAGERRLRAAKALKWDKVPCVVRREIKSDTSRLVYALIENIQRENLNPIEEAQGYMQLNRDFGLSHEEIGQRVGKSRVGITNIVRVLQLPAEIQRGVSEGKITMGHAKAILMIPDAEKQIRFYHHLVEEGLTVRKAEVRARRIQRATNPDGISSKKIGRGNTHPLAIKYSPMLENRYGYLANVKYNEDKHFFEVVFRVENDVDLGVLCGRLAGTEELPPADLDKDVMEG
ncbi:MAG: hypothetical protein A3C02_03020 [Candidatus Andersenbacteria bacterium RIFCSPHIGHO2_02_FULL_45_11]|nr:MAG: hypothetical protein A2805_01050 [Candidatus Andersenbacteria bacterium RIFCSPHIGHO2_01_FULL_46_36]OGY32688.1 MAG: hypothetical protein A3C02_03020 [Candidatus Andersenbacteria bacterium RIFCSPHIGHO2_02_FULL_45_11]